MKESNVVRGILSTLNSMDNVYCFRTHGSAFQMRGTPDIIGCAKGRFFAIEVKRSASLKPSPSQVYILNKINEALGKTFVSCHPKVPEVVEWINTL